MSLTATQARLINKVSFLKGISEDICQALFSAVDDDSAQNSARNIHQQMIIGLQPFSGKKSNRLKSVLLLFSSRLLLLRLLKKVQRSKRS